MAPNARDKAWGADRRDAAESAQLSFAQRRSWGGPREGAGRKPALRANVQHVARARHRRRYPLLITLRRAKGLPSMRSELLHRELRNAVRATRRAGFRIVHYSVQADHVHLVVEAEDNAALSAGMKSFTIRAAHRLNFRVLRRRRGRVWGDRYHRRDLRSPRQVRNALVYVISNHIKHGEHDVGLVDPCSSAAWFPDWMHKPDLPPEPSPTEAARTWLLDWGWHGGYKFLHLGELPRAARA